MNYTSLKQSFELVKLGVYIKSADMHYFNNGFNPPDLNNGFDIDHYESAKSNDNHDYLPVWSLEGLIKAIPQSEELQIFNLCRDHQYIWYCETKHASSENADLFTALYDLLVEYLNRP